MKCPQPQGPEGLFECRVWGRWNCKYWCVNLIGASFIPSKINFSHFSWNWLNCYPHPISCHTQSIVRQACHFRIRLKLKLHCPIMSSIAAVVCDLWIADCTFRIRVKLRNCGLLHMVGESPTEGVALYEVKLLDWWLGGQGFCTVIVFATKLRNCGLLHLDRGNPLSRNKSSWSAAWKGFLILIAWAPPGCEGSTL